MKKLHDLDDSLSDEISEDELTEEEMLKDIQISSRDIIEEFTSKKIMKMIYIPHWIELDTNIDRKTARTFLNAADVAAEVKSLDSETIAIIHDWIKTKYPDYLDIYLKILPEMISFLNRLPEDIDNGELFLSCLTQLANTLYNLSTFKPLDKVTSYLEERMLEVVESYDFSLRTLLFQDEYNEIMLGKTPKKDKGVPSSDPFTEEQVHLKRNRRARKDRKDRKDKTKNEEDEDL